MGWITSEFSQTFALDGEEEAAEFLRDPEFVRGCHDFSRRR